MAFWNIGRAAFSIAALASGSGDVHVDVHETTNNNMPVVSVSKVCTSNVSNDNHNVSFLGGNATNSNCGDDPHPERTAVTATKKEELKERNRIINQKRMREDVLKAEKREKQKKEK